MTKIDSIIELLYNIYVAIQNQNPPTQNNATLLTRQQVKDFLKISESTYKRKVKDGTLKPMKMPGGDLFYQTDLFEELAESKRKGRM
ncbi:helix-turn-helix transcriptional regulator [Pedobacter sp. AW1-32]|uniref:helix-turn-helix transcriptional regulator n=1 Tax=Pedobacter sp. AW1-32 TaxID=3383026 RepID=UPI003FEE5953